ncbi:MAG: polyprenol monophosphomannose synthase [Phycisphaerae bacterium]|nr:polyprenol monophosphomannose synthase [Phycisphaerae bacterium]
MSQCGQSTSGQTPEASIVIPTYREAENAKSLLTRIAQVMRRDGRLYEILIVDDDSRDGIDRVVRDLATICPARLITRTGLRDLSQAVLEGMRQARGRLILVMDADLSHPPEAIPRLLDALEKPPTDYVIGSRYVAGGRTRRWGRGRRFNSFVATLLARPLTGRIKDPMAGLFAIHRSTFERARGLDPVGYKIGLELLCRCRCQHPLEVPITFKERIGGQSKLNLEQQMRYLLHLDRLYRSYAWKWGIVVRPLLWALWGTLHMYCRLTRLWQKPVNAPQS